MTPKLTPAQIKTLNTISSYGGEMNSYAGQPGFYCLSVRPLVRDGYLEQIESCSGCAAGANCERPLAQKGGNSCYGRVRITAAGRAAVGA